MAWIVKQAKAAIGKVSTWLSDARKAQRKIEMHCMYYKHNRSKDTKDDLVEEFEKLKESIQYAIVDIDNIIAKLEDHNEH